jgi:MFS family permease
MAQPTLSSKLHRLALINVCLGQFMTALDSRSVIVALPTISIYFDTSLAVVQWIPLAYQLTIIGLVLSLARLGDMLGRKKIYGSGFLLLALGSVCCGLSTGLWQLIAFRVLAGIGGAMVLANGRALVSTLYAHEGRGPSPRHDFNGLSFGIYHRTFPGRISHRHSGLALDLFYQLAGCPGGRFHGVESSS